VGVRMAPSILLRRRRMYTSTTLVKASPPNIAGCGCALPNSRPGAFIAPAGCQLTRRRGASGCRAAGLHGLAVQYQVASFHCRTRRAVRLQGWPARASAIQPCQAAPSNSKVIGSRRPHAGRPHGFKRARQSASGSVDTGRPQRLANPYAVETGQHQVEHQQRGWSVGAACRAAACTCQTVVAYRALHPVSRRAVRAAKNLRSGIVSTSKMFMVGMSAQSHGSRPPCRIVPQAAAAAARRCLRRPPGCGTSSSSVPPCAAKGRQWQAQARCWRGEPLALPRKCRSNTCANSFCGTPMPRRSLLHAPPPCHRACRPAAHQAARL
jgi:hypothetical protein